MRTSIDALFWQWANGEKSDLRQQWSSWHGTLGSPVRVEMAKSSRVRAWPQGHHTMRTDSPCPQPQRELGTKTGTKHPKQAEKDLLFRNRLAEEMWKVMILYIRGTGRLEQNICWLLGEYNWENQTGSYYSIWGHNWKVNKQRVRLGGFFLTHELSPQSIISDALSMSNKKCNGSEKPYMFGEYFDLCPFGELHLFGAYLSSPCHTAPQFAPLWANLRPPLH